MEAGGVQFVGRLSLVLQKGVTVRGAYVEVDCG